MRKKLRPITELNDEIREKAGQAIRQLEGMVAEPQSIFVWNNLFFHDHDGTIYATFHDFIDIQPHCFSTPGPFRLSLYWFGDEIAVTSDIHNDVRTDICFIDSSGRQLIL